MRSEGASEFTDLFLDVVLLPDGETVLLDRDELDAAREANLISRETCELALKTAEEILAAAPGRLGDKRAFCEACVLRLDQKGR